MPLLRYPIEKEGGREEGGGGIGGGEGGREDLGGGEDWCVCRKDGEKLSDHFYN